jgi:hypothetical protein
MSMKSKSNRFDSCPKPIADAVNEFIAVSGVQWNGPRVSDFYKTFRQGLAAHWRGYINEVRLPVLRGELEHCKALDFSEEGSKPIADEDLYPEMKRLRLLIKNGIAVSLKPYIQEERIRAVEAGINRSNDDLRNLAMHETEWGGAATELYGVLCIFCDLLVAMKNGPACRPRGPGIKSAKLTEKFDSGGYREPLQNWFEDGSEFERLTLHVPDFFDSPWTSGTRLCEAFEVLDEDSVLWCDRLTEIEDYLQGNIPDPKRPTEIQRLDQRFCQAHRVYGCGSYLEKLPSIKKLYASNLSVEAEDEALRDICHGFLSRIYGERKLQQPVAPLAGRIHCRVCARRTESQAVNQGRRFVTGADRQSVPSSEFCHYHRPIGHDGSWDKSRQRGERQSTYQSRIDKIPIFAGEFERLLKMSPSQDARHPSSCSPDVEYFIERVMLKLDCYTDEDQDMRRIAWEIVEHGISDKRKKIISMATWGWKQVDIARAMKVSEQAISKSLHSIPPAYRFKPVSARRGQVYHHHSSTV